MSLPQKKENFFGFLRLLQHDRSLGPTERGKSKSRGTTFLLLSDSEKDKSVNPSIYLLDEEFKVINQKREFSYRCDCFFRFFLPIDFLMFGKLFPNKTYLIAP